MRGLLQPLKNLLPKHQLKPNVVLIRKHSPSTLPDLLRSTFEPICHPPSRSYTPTAPSEASLLWAKSGFFRRLFSTSHSPVCRADGIADRGVTGLVRLFLQKRSPVYVGFRRQGSPWRSFMSSPETVVYGLIGANIGIFLLWKLANRTFMSQNFTISLDNIKNGRIHTLVTSAFSHVDGFHIFSNMIGLYFFGSNIGNLFGPQFLLKLYLAGALGGSIFFLLHKVIVARSDKGVRSRHLQYATGLGASGAVNAVMLLDIFLFPKNIIYFEFFIPVPAALFGAFIIGHDLWRVKQGDTHVSGSAHLGGAVVAALAWARIAKRWI